MDNIERPNFDREAVSKSHQFSLAANIDFQFWSPNGKRKSNNEYLNWWFQEEEPLPPDGWKAASEWWESPIPENPDAKARMLSHRDESRSLSREQIEVVKLS